MGGWLVLAALAAACGGDTEDPPGTVYGTLGGTPLDRFESVELSCQLGGEPVLVRCGWGAIVSGEMAGLMLGFDITADYQNTAPGGALTLDTDFSIDEVNYLNPGGGGFVFGTPGLAVGELTATIDSHGTLGTIVTLDGLIANHPDFDNPFTVDIDRVPAALPP
jgi:hypothetical protein